ncbi:hypothetical protein C0J52_12646 [Blattella germanica]|nr:hypothetical protein C0J52_12646 [Blattella germanica]
MNDISNLASLLRENGDKVINGQSKLSLTINVLKSLNEAFALITESDEVCNSNGSFQVIDTNSSSVDKLHDIQFLHDFVKKTIGLKLINSAASSESFKGTVNISKFKSLRYLELRKCPINILNGIQSIRDQLQSVVCIRCIRRLEDLLFKCGADNISGFVWNGLREAVFSYNNIDLLDSSLQLTPWLQILDLSHNKIVQADAIELLPNLKYLNLSYNLLESIPSVHREACRKLQVLVIKNNYLEELSGLVELESLMELDLSCNSLSDHESLSPIFCLSALTWLSLEGNPLSFHRQHRIRTVNNLHNNAATGKAERLAVGSVSGASIRRTSLKDDASSAGSTPSKPQQTQGNKKSSKVREAVISEEDGLETSTELSSSSITTSIELSTDHLETKKQIETIRERFGKDKWLYSHAGTYVQDALGLNKTASTVTENILQSSPLDFLPVEQILSKVSEINIKVQNSELESCEPLKDEIPKESLQTEEEEEDIYKEEEQEEQEIEEDDDESEQQLYLVQRHRQGNQMLGEYFLVITERWLKEKEALSGKTLEKWAVDSLLSCIKAGVENSAIVVQLTFDTIRRDRQERLYIMEEEDAQRLLRTMNEMLESRPLTLNQIAFRCMKCSTQFSKEKSSEYGKNSLVCPTCSSTLVIEMEEVPLPSNHKNNFEEKQKANAENGSSSSGLNSSPSQCSIGSAASLDPFSDSPNNSTGPVKRWDSDIEIISNPSQSSIEVLDEQTRLQGSSTPARKRSSEEKQIISVVVPIPQPAEGNNHLVSLAGLTESSSSGSFTDSICTTYEIHSSSLTSRPGPLIPRVEEIDGGETEEKITSIEKNINDKKDLQPEKAANNVGSKLNSKDLDKSVEAQNGRENTVCKDRVHYCYTDFSIVDHRVKLFLYLHLFKEDHEELSFLVRAHIIKHTSTSYPGLFVVSTKNLYILQVTGVEGDDPEQWLQKVESYPIGKMLEVFPLPWHQGIGIEVQNETGGSSLHFLILQDQSYSNNFIIFLTNSVILKQCSVKHNPKEKQNLALQQILLSSVSGDEIDTNICLCSICSKCIVQRNEESNVLDMGTILVTPTDFVITDNKEWLVSTQCTVQKNCFTQKMSNLIEVGMESICQLILNFLDEVAGTDETWTLTFGTEYSLQTMLSAIKDPWEQLFSVPLTIINKTT